MHKSKKRDKTPTPTYNDAVGKVSRVFIVLQSTVVNNTGHLDELDCTLIVVAALPGDPSRSALHPHLDTEILVAFYHPGRDTKTHMTKVTVKYMTDVTED